MYKYLYVVCAMYFIQNNHFSKWEIHSLKMIRLDKAVICFFFNVGNNTLSTVHFLFLLNISKIQLYNCAIKKAMLCLGTLLDKVYVVGVYTQTQHTY